MYPPKFDVVVHILEEHKERALEQHKKRQCSDLEVSARGRGDLLRHVADQEEPQRPALRLSDRVLQARGEQADQEEDGVHVFAGAGGRGRTAAVRQDLRAVRAAAELKGTGRAVKLLKDNNDKLVDSVVAACGMQRSGKKYNGDIIMSGQETFKRVVAPGKVQERQHGLLQVRDAHLRA